MTETHTSPATVSRLSRQSGDPLQVLLVRTTDEPATAVELVLTAASHAGIEWHNTEDALDALARLAAEPVDVILLESPSFRNLDSSSVGWVKELASRVPVVLLTADQDINSLEMIEFGAVDRLHADDLTPALLGRVLHWAVERQKAATQLQSADKLLERENQRLVQRNENAFRFVDQVAHDFRTPLTVIKEFASILGDGLVGEVNPKQNEMLDVVGDRADDLAVMIDDMLDACKLEAGVLAPWRQEAHIEDVLQGLYRRLQRKATMRKVGFQMDIQKDLPAVYCDSDKLVRVFTNLVIRALKSCGENNSIEIRVRLGDDSRDVTVDVVDNGRSVDEESVRLTLERFRGEQEPGLCGSEGLGLAIARELTERNLGQMEVSVGADSGSRFSFTVPILDPEWLVVRWLDQVDRLKAPGASVALIVVSTDPTPEAATGVIDEFLQHAFSGSNLAMRAASDKWVVAAMGDAREIDHLLRRAEASWSETNRTRPSDQTPELTFATQGTWHIPSERDEFLAAYRTEFSRNPEANPATLSMAGQSLGA